MKNLKELSEEEIVKGVKDGSITRDDFLDSGVCPTCFDRKHGNVLYGDDASRMIYEDDELECFLVENPRATGHTVISTKKHFRDMMELDDETCKKVFVLAKKAMNVLREVYKAESVYECTMCDGEMNHFHLQLIPRYSYEKRGSKNFTKPRGEYEEDKEKIKSLRENMKK